MEWELVVFEGVRGSASPFGVRKESPHLSVSGLSLIPDVSTQLGITKSQSSYTCVCIFHYFYYFFALLNLNGRTLLAFNARVLTKTQYTHCQRFEKAFYASKLTRFSEAQLRKFRCPNAARKIARPKKQMIWYCWRLWPGNLKIKPSNSYLQQTSWSSYLAIVAEKSGKITVVNISNLRS